MFSVLLIATVIAGSDGSLAYLRCHFDPTRDEHKRPPMDVTLNEREGTATWKFPHIDQNNVGEASFYSDRVVFGVSDVRGLKLGGFIIDRSNLNFSVREMDVPERVTADTVFTHSETLIGTCELIETKRVF